MKIKTYFGNYNYIYANENCIYYVYALIDPFTNNPFYIGKGKGKRCFRHLFEHHNKYTHNYKKLEKIKQIREKGGEPIVKKIMENLPEKCAYDLELLFILHYGRIQDGGCLTNIIVDGWHKEYEKINNNTYKKIGEANRKRWQDPNSGYHTKEFKELCSLRRSGKNNGRYGDHRNMIELVGEERAKKLKDYYSKRCSGAGNPNSKLFKLTDKEGKVYYVKGGLKKFCKEHNLYMCTLKRYINHVVPEPKQYDKRREIMRKNTNGWKLEEINEKDENI